MDDSIPLRKGINSKISFSVITSIANSVDSSYNVALRI